MTKCVCVASGGGDSITNGLMMLKSGHEVIFLNVDHGQKGSLGERFACKDIVQELQKRGYPCRLELVRFTWLGRLGGSGLTVKKFPVPNGLEGTYGSTIGQIFTPNRNSILLGIAGALAEKEMAEFITLGANRSEQSYSDNTKEYLDQYSKVLEYSCYHIHPMVFSPEWELDKVGIYRWAIENDFSRVLDLTWSCDDVPYYTMTNPTKREQLLMCGHCGCDRNRQLTFFILNKLGVSCSDNAGYADKYWFSKVFIPTIREKGIPKNKWFSKYAKELECKVLE